MANQLQGVRHDLGALETRLDAKLQSEVEERRQEAAEMVSKMNDVVERIRKLEVAEKVKKRCRRRRPEGPARPLFFLPP